MTNPIAAPAADRLLDEADRLLAQRLRIIAAIHALAQFLADFPDVPTPHMVQLWAHVHDGPAADRLAALDRLVDDHDGVRARTGDYEYAHLYLGTTATHGADLRYSLATTRRADRTEQP